MGELVKIHQFQIIGKFDRRARLLISELGRWLLSELGRWLLSELSRWGHRLWSELSRWGHRLLSELGNRSRGRGESHLELFERLPSIFDFGFKSTFAERKRVIIGDRCMVMLDFDVVDHAIEGTFCTTFSNDLLIFGKCNNVL